MRHGPTCLETIVSGLGETAIEVAEQLSWLGSALRSSPRELGLVRCTPCIVVDRTDTNIAQLVDSYSRTQALDASFSIRFAFTAVDLPSYEPGYCWSTMFRNTVIVQGYPIRRRTLPGSGLETSIDILARLVDAHTMDGFNERLYLKGFSSMLVATDIKNGFVLWHHSYNKKGQRVSYNDVGDVAFTKVSGPEVENARRIVGWSARINYNAGKSLPLRYALGILILINCRCLRCKS